AGIPRCVCESFRRSPRAYRRSALARRRVAAEKPESQRARRSTSRFGQRRASSVDSVIGAELVLFALLLDCQLVILNGCQIGEREYAVFTNNQVGGRQRREI